MRNRYKRSRRAMQDRARPCLQRVRCAGFDWLQPASSNAMASFRTTWVLPPANRIARIERACAARDERECGRNGACRGSRIQGRTILHTCQSVDIALRSCKPAVKEISSIPWPPSAIRISPESAHDKECNGSVCGDAGDRRDVPPRLERPHDSGRHCPMRTGLRPDDFLWAGFKIE